MAGVEIALPIGGDGEAEQLQREQHPGDGLQPVGVGGDERVARAHRLDHRDQPLEDGMVEQDGDEAERGDGAQAHDHRRYAGVGRDAERGQGPLLGDDGRGQQGQDRRAGQPVEHDEDAQDDIGDGQCGRMPHATSPDDLSINDNTHIVYSASAFLEGARLAKRAPWPRAQRLVLDGGITLSIAR